MNRAHTLLIAATTLVFVAACNRQPAPCPQTSTNQTAPTVESSPAISAPATAGTDSGGPSFKPKRGYVPDEQTAVAIAVAVWIPIYGKEQIESEKPFKATLKNGVWFVEGSLDEPRIGGTAMAEIAQNDGRVLSVFHYK